MDSDLLAGMELVNAAVDQRHLSSLNLMKLYITNLLDKYSDNITNLSYRFRLRLQSRQEPFLSDCCSGTFLIHFYVWRSGKRVPFVS